MNIHTPKWTPILGVGVWWTPGTSEKDCKGQNPSPCGVLYIIEKLLKRNVQNGLAWPIWTSATQVMAKRRVGSQIGSLTPDHGKSGINPIPLRASGVQHDVEKLSTRATTSVQTSSRLEVCTRNCSPAKLRDSQPWWFWDSHLRVPRQKAIRMPLSWGGTEYIIWGKVVASPSLGRGESCESKVARGSS
jgi:hypothetical protein